MADIEEQVQTSHSFSSSESHHVLQHSDSRVNAETTKFQTSYYDLPLNEGAPAYELRIYNYLKLQNVQMSHPSMKSVTFLSEGKSSGSERNLMKESSLLASRKSKLASRSFKNLALSIKVPVARSYKLSGFSQD